MSVFNASLVIDDATKLMMVKFKQVTKLFSGRALYTESGVNQLVEDISNIMDMEAIAKLAE